MWIISTVALTYFKNCFPTTMWRRSPKLVGFPKTTQNNRLWGEMRRIWKNGLLLVKWKDTNEETVCRTFHRADRGETERRRVRQGSGWWTKLLSLTVKDCNKFMGGVDLSDALIQYYSVRGKTMKRYKIFLYHFIDISAVNSYIIFKMLAIARGEITTSQWETNGGDNKGQQQLLLNPARPGNAGPDSLEEQQGTSGGFVCGANRSLLPNKPSGVVHSVNRFCLQPDRNRFED